MLTLAFQVSKMVLTTLITKCKSCKYLTFSPILLKYTSLSLLHLFPPNVYAVNLIFCGSTYVLDSRF